MIDSNASGEAQAANSACKDCKSTQGALAAMRETLCAIYNKLEYGDVYQWDDGDECWQKMREMCSHGSISGSVMDIKDDSSSNEEGRAGACQCHRAVRAHEIVWVDHLPAVYAWPRKGFIGKLIDLFSPRYRPNAGYSGFIAHDEAGREIRSQDGITWTVSR